MAAVHGGMGFLTAFGMTVLIYPHAPKIVIPNAVVGWVGRVYLPTRMFDRSGRDVGTPGLLPAGAKGRFARPTLAVFFASSKNDCSERIFVRNLIRN